MHDRLTTFAASPSPERPPERPRTDLGEIVGMALRKGAREESGRLLQEMRDSGVGYQPADLGEQPGTREAARAVPTSVWQERTGPNPLSDNEVDDIMRGPHVSQEALAALPSQPPAETTEPRSYSGANRRIYVENPDGSAQTEADRGEAYDPARQDRAKADDDLLATMNPALRDKGLETYGHEGLVAILRGEQQLPHYTGPETGQAMFTHASTGEQLTPDQVAERMSPREAQRIGHEAHAAVELATARRPFAEEIMNTPDGIAYKETGRLDDETDMQLVIGPNGEVLDVRVIVKAAEGDPNGGGEHVVDVINPESSEPEALIDGEPATAAEAPTVEAVLEHVQDIVRTPEEETPATEAVEPVEITEKLPEELAAPVGPEQQAPAPTPVEQANPRPELSAEQRQQVSVFNSARQLIGSNPQFLRSMQEMGIDTTTLRPEHVQLTPALGEAIQHMRALGVRPDSAILREVPRTDTALGRAAKEAQEAALAVLAAMFEQEHPE